MGGQTLERECDSNTDLAEVYNPVIDAWRSIASMPQHVGHIGPSVFAINPGERTNVAVSALDSVVSRGYSICKNMGGGFHPCTCRSKHEYSTAASGAWEK